MSVEIEVGLENAARVPRITEEELALGETPKGLANPRIRRLLYTGGAVVLAAISGLYLYFHNRETTDDAQVDGHITPMASKVYGRAGGFGEGASNLRPGTNGGPGVGAGERGKEPGQCGIGEGGPGAVHPADGEGRDFEAAV